jgi:hypothetical protein
VFFFPLFLRLCFGMQIIFRVGMIDPAATSARFMKWSNDVILRYLMIGPAFATSISEKNFAIKSDAFKRQLNFDPKRYG